MAKSKGRKKAGKRKVRVLCPSCGSLGKRKAVRCRKCGVARPVRSAKKATNVVSIAKAARISCGSCGRSNRPANDFCTGCSAPMNITAAFKARARAAREPGTPEFWHARALAEPNPQMREYWLDREQEASQRQLLVKSAAQQRRDHQALMALAVAEPDPARREDLWKQANAWIYERGGAS